MLHRFCTAALTLALGAAGSPPLPAQDPAPQQLVLLRWTRAQEHEGHWTLLRHTGLSSFPGNDYVVPEGSALVITKVMATLDASRGVHGWGILRRLKAHGPEQSPTMLMLRAFLPWFMFADAGKGLYLPPQPTRDGELPLVCDELDLDYGIPFPPGSQLVCWSDVPGRWNTAFPLKQLDCIGYFQRVSQP